jgi:hypothetical protein
MSFLKYRNGVNTMMKSEAIAADLEQKNLFAATEATAMTERQFLEYIGRWQDVCNAESPRLAPAPDFSTEQVIVDLISMLSQLTLYGIPNTGDWQFRCELINTVSIAGNEEAGQRISDATGEWLAARHQLDCTCEHWYFLTPIYVHPDFREKVLKTVERKFTLFRLKIGMAEIS